MVGLLEGTRVGVGAVRDTWPSAPSPPSCLACPRSKVSLLVSMSAWRPLVPRSPMMSIQMPASVPAFLAAASRGMQALAMAGHWATSVR